MRRRVATRKPRPAVAGMTLIEVMMAMAIFAMISTMLYGGFVQTARNKERIQDRLDRAHEVRTGVQRMAHELSMAYASIHRNPSPALQTMITGFVGKESGGGSRINFTSFSHQRLYRDAKESDQNELSYYVTDHPNDSGRKVVARREQSRIDDNLEDGGRTQILIDDVVSLELQYLDDTTGQWLSSWDSTQDAMQPNRLPSQVLIRVTVPSTKGYGPDEVVATRVSLPLRFALNHAVYKF